MGSPSAPAIPAERRTRIIVVGGGAGGLELVTRLATRLDRKSCEVMLVDRSRTHVWKPLLHEVATGALDANLDELAYGAHARRWGYTFVLGEMEAIDRVARELILAPLWDEAGRQIGGRQRIAYDGLVLAIGSEANDFGAPGVRENCLRLDSRVDADRFRQRLLEQCQRVSRAASASPPRTESVRIAIVGAGATGVELAAELHEVARSLGAHGSGLFDQACIETTLIEAAPRILPALGEKLSAAARVELEKLGVRVRAGVKIVAALPGGFMTADGEMIGADLLLWVAGVKAPPVLERIDGLERSRSGQLLVQETLQTTNDDRIWAIGDCCACPWPGSERPVPPRAQAAHQMAATACENITRGLRGRSLRQFRYHDHGSLVSLSRYMAIGTLMGALVGGQLAIQGTIARLFYKSLYAMHLTAIHGSVRGAVHIALGAVNRVIRPRLKLH